MDAGSAHGQAESDVLFYVSCCEKMGVDVLPEVVSLLSADSTLEGEQLRLRGVKDGELESVLTTLARINGVGEGAFGGAEGSSQLTRLELFDGKFGIRGVSALASTIENDKCVQALR